MNKGFTLIELTVALAILSIMTTLIVPKTTTLIRRSMEAATLGNLATMRAALDLYKLNTDGAILNDIQTLKGEYLNDIPSTLTWHHPRGNSTGAGSYATIPAASTNWFIVTTVGDDQFQKIFVACEHTALKGKKWNTF